jgi:sensor histidine kinase YesM
MKIHQPNEFLFASKYHVGRHAAFWLSHSIFSLLVWYDTGVAKILFGEAVWLPVWMLYSYTFIYWLLPKFLLKERYLAFGLTISLWVIVGWALNALFRAYVFIPLQEAMGFQQINTNPFQTGTFLELLTTAGFAGIITLFKHWMKKQQEWMQAQKEKVTIELQMLKAQVHPHFLFNTLNNIYSFSLENSPKTPSLVLKLSSLLSYILYDCKAEQVLLEKELEVMKAYIDLEKERYANNIEISLSMEGDIKGKYIAPLLLLPFLENAFKHGTSEQLERPWLSMDIAVKGQMLKCKIANSKNEFVPVSPNGIGIENVRKRLRFLYPDKHEVKLTNEEDFFVVSLLIELVPVKMDYAPASIQTLLAAENTSV